VREHGDGDDESGFSVREQEGLRELEAIPRGVRVCVHVVVEETKFGIHRGQVALTPLDHALVDVDPDVATGSRPLEEQLAGESPAAEVEHGLVGLGREGEHRRARGVVEGLGLGRSH
jgi:hypothetical protein